MSIQTGATSSTSYASTRTTTTASARTERSGCAPPSPPQVILPGLGDIRLRSLPRTGSAGQFHEYAWAA